MEYIKKEELIKGEIYKGKTLYDRIILYNEKESYTINTELLMFNKLLGDPKLDNNINFLNIATPEEKHWLETCITADKFITFEEVMKTFIPEYVEYINTVDSSWKLGKIYKVDKDGKINFESGYKSNYIYYNDKTLFKPSTKEAYDTQFVVKEPEFVLPEEWCIKVDNENESILLNFINSKVNCKRIFHKSNQNIYIGKVIKNLSSVLIENNYFCYDKSFDIKEITFEQFKKYVLKEETTIEFGNKIDKEIIEPLPQFKVIETIETITKVENNEGNQFFIGDVVKSSNGVIQTIESFDYNKAKTNIIAFTNKQSVLGNGIGIDKIEHYIETKVEVKDNFILPENWHIVITKENVDIVKKWWDSKNYGVRVWDIGACYGIDNKDCCSKTEKRQLSFNNKEITFDQFKKYVLKEITSEEPGMIFIPEETLLEKAKRLYPVGTKFKAARGSRSLYNVTPISEFKENSDGAICIQNNGNGTIYFNGVWGEIIE